MKTDKRKVKMPKEKKEFLDRRLARGESKVIDLLEEFLAMGYITAYEKNPPIAGNFFIYKQAPIVDFEINETKLPALWKMTPGEPFLRLGSKFSVSPDGNVYFMLALRDVHLTRRIALLYYYRDNIYVNVINRHLLFRRFWEPKDWAGASGDKFRARKKDDRMYSEYLRKWKEEIGWK